MPLSPLTAASTCTATAASKTMLSDFLDVQNIGCLLGCVTMEGDGDGRSSFRLFGTIHPCSPLSCKVHTTATLQGQPEGETLGALWQRWRSAAGAGGLKGFVGSGYVAEDDGIRLYLERDPEGAGSAGLALMAESDLPEYTSKTPNGVGDYARQLNPAGAQCEFPYALGATDPFDPETGAPKTAAHQPKRLLDLFPVLRRERYVGSLEPRGQ